MYFVCEAGSRGGEATKNVIVSNSTPLPMGVYLADLTPKIADHDGDILRIQHTGKAIKHHRRMFQRSMETPLGLFYEDR